MFSIQSSYRIVSPTTTRPLRDADVHYNDNADDMMIFGDSSYDDNDNHHYQEHGVDEDFLNQLYHIADHNNESTTEHQQQKDCSILTIPALDEHQHDHDDAVMIEDDDDSDNQSSETQSISSSSSSPHPSSFCSSSNNSTTGSSNSIPSSYSSLVAPNSNMDGIVNAYFVVDPINNIVFFPKQTISCQIDDHIVTAEYGPFVLPTFDMKAISS